MSRRYAKQITLQVSNTVIPDVPDKPSISSATDVGTSRAFNNGAVSVVVSPAATGGAVTSYTVTSNPGSFTGTGASPVVVTGLTSANSYTFSAQAVNSTGTSSSSSSSGAVTATTTPQAPTVGSPTVSTGQSYTGNANVSVPFTAGASGGKSITSYTVTSSSGNTGSGSSSPINVSDVVGTARTYSVTATNANGTSSSSSSSASVTPSSVPQAPTIGTATVTNSTTVSLTFTAGATGGSTITSYSVTSSPSISLSVSGTTSPLTVTGSFAAGQAYTFTIAAVNANGTSTASSASGSVTPYIPGFFASIRNTASKTINAEGVSVDASGNVYVCGYVSESGNNEGLLIQENSSGVEQWASYYAGQVNSGNQVSFTSVITDSSGNVYAAGYYNTGSTPSQVGFLVKYNSSGSVQWSKSIINGSNNGGVGTLSIDSSGNIVVPVNGNIIGIIRFNSSGTVLSQVTSASGYLSSGGGNVSAVDSSGNYYAGGQLGNGSNYYGALLKWNSSGTLQWQVYAGTYNGVTGISVDSSGNIYTVDGYSLTLVKWNSSGSLQWQKTLGSGSYTGIVLDSSGNIWVNGYNNPSSPTEAVIAKYDSSGNLLLQRTITPAGGAMFYGYRGNLAIDSNFLYATYHDTSTSPVGILAVKLHLDGSGTGTYSVGGKTYTYSAGGFTSSSGSLSTGTTGISSVAGSLTVNSLSDPVSSALSSVTTATTTF